MKLGIVFKTAPYQENISREGIETLLSFSNIYSEITVFFIEYGILNIYPNQRPEAIKQKDYFSNFKLLDLYEINKRYICKESAVMLGLYNTEWLIDTAYLERREIISKLRQANLILTF